MLPLDIPPNMPEKNAAINIKNNQLRLFLYPYLTTHKLPADSNIIILKENSTLFEILNNGTSDHRVVDMHQIK